MGVFLGRRADSELYLPALQRRLSDRTLPFAVDRYRTEDERVLLAHDIGNRGANRRKKAAAYQFYRIKGACPLKDPEMRHTNPR